MATYLQHLENIGEVVAKSRDTVKQNFGHMVIHDLLVKPKDGGWSPGECLEHVNFFGDYYIPIIEKKLKGRLKKTSIKDMTYKPGILGGYFVNMMRLQDGVAKNKMKTPRSKDPSRLEVPEKVVERFCEQCDEFLRLIEISKTKDIRSIRVKFAFFWLQLRLADAFAAIGYHMERHVAQAVNAGKSAGTLQ